jgi:hypothetical protein
MAAALLFSLNGIPLIYNGQEIGDPEYPYTAEYIFYPGYPINHDDPDNLFQYYSYLIHLRESLPALYGNNFKEVPVNPNNYIFGFRRWQGNQNVFCIINMGNSSVSAVLSLPVSNMNLDSSVTYYLTDMVNGEVFSGKPSILASLNIPVDKYTTRILLFADTAAIVTGINQKNNTNIPVAFGLSQNYPNPFNPATMINYSIPHNGNVSLKVYDILGKEITRLVSGIKSKGNYSVRFNGENLSSGIYFYRLEYEGKFITHKMILIK